MFISCADAPSASKRYDEATFFQPTMALDEDVKAKLMKKLTANDAKKTKVISALEDSWQQAKVDIKAGRMVK